MGEMKGLGVEPNIKTYTTLIRGWARASFPEKALKCFEDIKLAGLKPDKAVYHCILTSLLSRAASISEQYVYQGILGIVREMVEEDLMVDMRTAVHWSKYLCKIERTGGELTETLQKTFPPSWTSHKSHLVKTNSRDQMVEQRLDCGGNYVDLDVESFDEYDDDYSDTDEVF